MVIGDLGLRDITAMLAGVPENIGREINTHIMTHQEFFNRRAQGEHFVTHVLGEPKLFIIGDEHEFGKVG